MSLRAAALGRVLNCFCMKETFLTGWPFQPFVPAAAHLPNIKEQEWE